MTTTGAIVPFRARDVRRMHQAPRRRERLIALFKEWRNRSAGRRALATMSARSLQDIGVTPYEAYLEVNKPFWRA
jgi:uncharacterized protein YjiS (DUF1127 family)